MTATILVGLAVAGAAGAVARHLLDGVVENRMRTAFPWGTFVVNATGSLLLGLVVGAALYRGLPLTPTTWLGTGFCGSYTTFSTFTFQTVRLVEEGAGAGAVLNVVASVLVGTAAAAVGLMLAASI